MGAILAAILLLSQTTATPQIASSAQSTPPPVIVEVHSQPQLCTALKTSIGPSVAGLLQNDRTIAEGLANVRTMGGDGGSLRSGMDALYLENDVSSIVRYLGKIDHLLAPSDPPETNSDEAQKIETMKKALRDVARQQLMTLNVLDGTLESQQMSEFTDTSDMPNFSAPTQEGTSATRHDAQDRSGPEAATGGEPLVRSAADVFPALGRTERLAAQVIVADSAGCERINEPLTIKP